MFLALGTALTLARWVDPSYRPKLPWHAARTGNFGGPRDFGQSVSRVSVIVHVGYCRSFSSTSYLLYSTVCVQGQGEWDSQDWSRLK